MGRRLCPWFGIALALAGCAAGGASDGGIEDDDAGRRRDAGAPLAEVPGALSETGLFLEGASGDYAPGVLTFEVRYTSWVDDSAKRRHLWLPPGESIDTSDPDAWRFPRGTRIWKEFFVDGRPVETRLLLKTDDAFGAWTYVSYLYDADGAEAVAVPDGQPDALGTEHDVPDQAGCFECHQGGADFPLGLSAMQLTRTSFDALVGEGAVPRGTAFGTIPGNEVEREALGYLHANCGHCHVDGHPASETRSLRFNLTVGIGDPTESNTYTTAVGGVATDRVDGTRVWIVAGDPDMSQVVARMGQRSAVGMPPRFTDEVDAFGVNAVRTWIAALEP